MSKIYLSGDKEVEVSRSDAERVENELREKVPLIQINETVMVKSRDIKRIEKDKIGGKLDYDLDDPSDRKVIRIFEEELRAEESKPLIKTLGYYGSPYEKKQGYVFNDLLGLVHWSLVEYCVRNGIVHKSKSMDWTITDYGSYRKTNISPFNEFDAKYRSLSRLLDRRAYAQRKSDEGTFRSEIDQAESTMFKVQ